MLTYMYIVFIVIEIVLSLYSCDQIFLINFHTIHKCLFVGGKSTYLARASALDHRFNEFS